MNAPASSAIASANVRFHSIDVFRAIIMFFMIIVNELSGAEGVPRWIDHPEATEDALGFADIIFPAFLFIVGLSIPPSIRYKVSKGSSPGQIAWFIMYRSFA